MVRLKVLLASVMIVGMGAVPAAIAQTEGELSVEEITDVFKKQKTRGLVIVPSAVTAEAAQNEGEETATIASTGSEEYKPVERQSQINVQISFDFDSAALRSDQQPKLVNMCKSMQAMEGTVFQIIGHTDSSGPSAYNQRLSLLRAQEVRRHLISTCGIPDNMLRAIGMGETAPFDNADPRGDINRRVEFQALG